MSGDSSGEEGALQIDVGQEEPEEKPVKKGRKAAVWRPGDLVWAKVLGFNFWPAKVLDPEDDLVPDWLKDPPKPTYILVRFFGTYDIQWVSSHTTQSYENGIKKKLHSKSKSRAFMKAVKEVKDFIENGQIPEGMTCQPPDQRNAGTGQEDKPQDSSEDSEGVPTESQENAKGLKRRSSGRKTETSVDDVASNKKPRLHSNGKKKDVNVKQDGRRAHDLGADDHNPVSSTADEPKVGNPL